MIINCNPHDRDKMYIPHEVPAPYRHAMLDNERSYDIPGATGYILTDFGRVFRATGKQSESDYPLYERLCPFYFINSKDVLYGRDEHYSILFDGDDKPKAIPIPLLIQLVFFPHKKNMYIVNPRSSWIEDITSFTSIKNAQHHIPFFESIDKNEKKYVPNIARKWEVQNLKLLNHRRMTQYIRAKCKNREFKFKDSEGIILARWNPKTGAQKQIHVKYDSMKRRCTDEKFHIYRATYKGTKIDDRWFNNPYTYYQDLLDMTYPYNKESLEFDKDFMTMGEQKYYSLGTAVPLPSYLNNFFKSEGNPVLGYNIRNYINKHGKERYYIICHPLKCIGDKRKPKRKVYKSYQCALNAGRRYKADIIRRIAKYEAKAKKINPFQQFPDEYIQHLYAIADLVEQGKIQMFEPSKEIKERYGVS